MPPFDTADKKAAAIAAIEALEQEKDGKGKVVKQGLTQIESYKDNIRDGKYTSNPAVLSDDIQKLAKKIKQTRDGYAEGKSKQPAANATRIELWPKLLAILEEEGTNANRSYVNTKLGRAAAAAAAGPGGGSASRGRSTRKNGASGRSRSTSRRAGGSANVNLLNLFGTSAAAAAPGGGGGGSGSTGSRGASGAAALAAHRERVTAYAAERGMSFGNARKTLKAQNNAARNAAKAAKAAAAPAGKARGRSRSGSRRGAGGAAASSATPSFNNLLNAAYAQESTSTSAFNPFNDPRFFGGMGPGAPAAASAAAAAAGAPGKKTRAPTDWNAELKAVRAEMNAEAASEGKPRPSQAKVMAEAKRRRNARKGAGGAAAAEEFNLLQFPPKEEE
jgi:hypothetical protein